MTGYWFLMFGESPCVVRDMDLGSQFVASGVGDERLEMP